PRPRPARRRRAGARVHRPAARGPARDHARPRQGGPAMTPAPATAPGRTATPVPRRAATTLVTLVVPLVVMVATVALALSWRDRLPDPVASHWGPDGVDGASSFAGLVSIRSEERRVGEACRSQ